jgi:hypothetical protein
VSSVGSALVPPRRIVRDILRDDLLWGKMIGLGEMNPPLIPWVAAVRLAESTASDPFRP